jgi:hypothetical protein
MKSCLVPVALVAFSIPAQAADIQLRRGTWSCGVTNKGHTWYVSASNDNPVSLYCHFNCLMKDKKNNMTYGDCTASLGAHTGQTRVCRVDNDAAKWVSATTNGISCR